ATVWTYSLCFHAPVPIYRCRIADIGYRRDTPGIDQHITRRNYFDSGVPDDRRRDNVLTDQQLRVAASYQRQEQQRIRVRIDLDGVAREEYNRYRNIFLDLAYDVGKIRCRHQAATDKEKIDTVLVREVDQNL